MSSKGDETPRATWYEARARNLGKEFLGEIDHAVNAVQRAPMM